MAILRVLLLSHTVYFTEYLFALIIFVLVFGAVAINVGILSILFLFDTNSKCFFSKPEREQF